MLPGESLAKYTRRREPLQSSPTPGSRRNRSVDAPSDLAVAEEPKRMREVDDGESQPGTRLRSSRPMAPNDRRRSSACGEYHRCRNLSPPAEVAEFIERGYRRSGGTHGTGTVEAAVRERGIGGRRGGGSRGGRTRRVVWKRAAEAERHGSATRDSEGERGGGALLSREGPEPARIPTSLTATLREQGRIRVYAAGTNVAAHPARAAARDGAMDSAGKDSRRVVRSPTSRGPHRMSRGRRNAPPRRRPRGPERADNPPLPSISDLLKEGQEIIVQIAKEPLGQKGARITSHIALPGRFLVYMPTVDHIGVSRKIPSDDERLRLKRILQNNRTGIPGGYIVRTAGDGRTEEELRADMMFLYNMWLDMRQKAERRPAPLLIHHDLNVVERILRDQLTSSFKSIWVDNEEVYESVLRFVQRFQPALVNRVKLYTRSTPIFDEFGITAELEKALRPKVWLKSGGYIVINQTEALVAIDINTGKYVGKSNRLEDTIVKTNTDAIKEIVRQIRLRDLGGIIVVDFIDMDERKNRQKVMQALEEAMRADRAPYKILQFNDFGLVAITRKRVKQSLERTLCTPCPYCEGAGYVKSPNTVIGEILRKRRRSRRQWTART